MKKIAAVFCTLLIPALLFLLVWQSSSYSRLERELQMFERQQTELVSANRRLISQISVLSSPERIERVAITTLGMRKATPSEILRIELKKGDLGG